MARSFSSVVMLATRIAVTTAPTSVLDPTIRDGLADLNPFPESPQRLRPQCPLTTLTQTPRRFAAAAEPDLHGDYARAEAGGAGGAEEGARDGRARLARRGPLVQTRGVAAFGDDWDREVHGLDMKQTAAAFTVLFCLRQAQAQESETHVLHQVVSNRETTVYTRVIRDPRSGVQGTGVPVRQARPPQCPQHLRWSTDDWFENFHKEVTARYRLDTNRICLTGPSLGGSGTWYLAARSTRAGRSTTGSCNTTDDRVSTLVGNVLSLSPLEVSSSSG